MRPLLDAPSQLESLVRRSQDQSLWSVSISASRLHRRRRLAALGIRPQLRTLGGVASMRAQDPASATASCRHVHHSHTCMHRPSCGEVDLRRPFFGGLVAGCEARDGKRERAHDHAQAPTTYRHGVQRLLRCRRVRRRRSRALHGMARRRRRSMDEGPKWKVVVLAVDDMMRAKRGIFPEPESVQNGRRSRTMPQWGTRRRNLRLLQRLSEPR